IIANGTPPTDTDQDGMPDFWEDANSLDKDDPADRNGDDDSDGFTNLEEYLNSIIGDTMYVPPPPVSPPSIDVSYSYDDASVFLQWVSNNFVNVVSVQLYQSESDDLSDPQIYSLEKSQDTLTIESLTRGTTYYFAFSITDSSSFESFVSDTIAVVPNKTFTTQAEDASHIGIVFVDDNHIGFHGTAFTNFDASNSAVEFTNMPGYAGGECTLLYRYALGNSDRTGSLTVNGKTSSLTMHNTGDWANWVLDSVKINLNPGYDNTIRFSVTGSDFGNLDEITIVPENLTSIESENNSEALSQFELYQNYPNPFNPITTINFTIPKASHVTLVVFDMLGKEVDKLVDEQKKPGAYSAIFNAENLASGIYFYKLQAGDIILVKKSVLLK
ncbi:MAG: T9SS type A sorting domain-containing protein, partial [Calditrichaceae bacterium]